MNDDKADDKSKVQGEGDYAAADAYNQATRDFVEAGKVPSDVNNGQDLSAEDQSALEEAEDEGKRRAKEEDPQVSRDYSNAQ